MPHGHPDIGIGGGHMAHRPGGHGGHLPIGGQAFHNHGQPHEVGQDLGFDISGGAFGQEIACKDSSDKLEALGGITKEEDNHKHATLKCKGSGKDVELTCEDGNVWKANDQADPDKWCEGTRKCTVPKPWPRLSAARHLAAAPGRPVRAASRDEAPESAAAAAVASVSLRAPRARDAAVVHVSAHPSSALRPSAPWRRGVGAAAAA
eukprot:gene5657-5613_t